MIVYCDAEECKHYSDRKCACQWQTGERAIKIELSWQSFVAECTDYEISEEFRRHCDE